MKLTVNDLNKMTSRSDYNGFGYLRHEKRSKSSDNRLIRQANSLGLLSEDLFSWANSKPARHFMDNYTLKVPFPLTKKEPYLITGLMIAGALLMKNWRK